VDDLVFFACVQAVVLWPEESVKSGDLGANPSRTEPTPMLNFADCPDFLSLPYQCRTMTALFRAAESNLLMCQTLFVPRSRKRRFILSRQQQVGGRALPAQAASHQKSSHIKQDVQRPGRALSGNQPFGKDWNRGEPRVKARQVSRDEIVSKGHPVHWRWAFRMSSRVGRVPFWMRPTLQGTFLLVHTFRSGSMAEFLPLAGPWDAEKDGAGKGDGTPDEAGLIKTACRIVKEQADVDISGCTSWFKLLEVYYTRPVEVSKTVGGSGLAWVIHISRVSTRHRVHHGTGPENLCLSADSELTLAGPRCSMERFTQRSASRLCTLCLA
jgi:hypothetical protein